MSLWVEIHKIALEHPEGPPKPIARVFLDHISDDELVDLIADAISSARRNLVRHAEREAFTPLPLTPVEIEGFEEHITEAIEARRPTRISREQFVDLLDKSFALSHRGPRVLWGEATVAQHRERIGMLQQLVQGIERTIEQHEAAIVLIEAESATCLNAVIRPELIVQ